MMRGREIRNSKLGIGNSFCHFEFRIPNSEFSISVCATEISASAIGSRNLDLTGRGVARWTTRPAQVHLRRKAAPFRLYVLDCGTMKARDGVAHGLSREQVAPRDLSDPCALIVSSARHAVVGDRLERSGQQTRLERRRPPSVVRGLAIVSTSR
jgi:hypothetical protein